MLGDLFKPFAVIFDTIFLLPIINLLVAFYVGLVAIHIPGAFGWSIIIMTVLIRLVLYPLTTVQLKSAKKMADLKPHLDHLHQKHKDDKKRLEQEKLRLFKEAGVNPAAGCLPFLIQFPVLIALNNVFFNVLGSSNGIDYINKVVYLPILKLTSIDLSFFGLNLGVKPDMWPQAGAWLLSVPLFTAALTYLQSKVMMTPPNPAVKKKGDGEDMAAVMQQSMMFMPVMIGFFAYSFPVGLSLYWNISTLFGIIQQVLVSGWGGLTPYVRKLKK